MPWIESDGRTVDEARAAAVAAHGLPVEELEIEVIHEGARGLFGLGGEPAVVRARPLSEAQDFRDAFHHRPADQRPEAAPPGEQPGTTPTVQQPGTTPAVVQTTPAAPQPGDEVVGEVADQAVAIPESPAGTPDLPIESEYASEQGEGAPVDHQETIRLGESIVRGILEQMQLDGQVAGHVSGQTVVIDVTGEDLGLLIGRGGATLSAIQEIVRTVVRRKLEVRSGVVVDVESYWQRHSQLRGQSDGQRRQGQSNRRRRRPQPNS